MPKKVESDSETAEQDGILDFLEKKRSHVVKKRNAVNNRYQHDNDEDGFDHNSFIESMLSTFNDDKQSEIQKQIREEEDKLEQIKQLEQSKFNDNQYWADNILESQFDLDELMKDF